MPALRRVAVVGMADEDHADAKVQILLFQPEELSLPQTGIDRGCKQGPPFGRRIRQDGCYLMATQEVRLPLWDPQDLHVVDRIRAGDLLLFDGSLERAPQEAPQMIDGLWTEWLPLGAVGPSLLVEILLDFTGRRLRWSLCREGRRQQVEVDRAVRLLVRRLALAYLFEPPLQQLPDGWLGLSVLWLLYAETDPLTEPFFVIRKATCFGLGLRAALDAPPVSLLVFVAQVVTSIFLEDRRHQRFSLLDPRRWVLM